MSILSNLALRIQAVYQVISRIPRSLWWSFRSEYAGLVSVRNAHIDGVRIQEEKKRHQDTVCPHAHPDGWTTWVAAAVSPTDKVVICQHCQKVVREGEPGFDGILLLCHHTLGPFYPNKPKRLTDEEAAKEAERQKALDEAYSLPMKQLKKLANAQLRARQKRK